MDHSETAAETRGDPWWEPAIADLRRAEREGWEPGRVASESAIRGWFCGGGAPDALAARCLGGVWSFATPGEEFGRCDRCARLCAMAFGLSDPELARLAVAKGAAGFLGALLDNGVRVGARDPSGSTLLHLAAREGRAGVARLLLDRGADPLALNCARRAPSAEFDRSGIWGLKDPSERERLSVWLASAVERSRVAGASRPGFRRSVGRRGGGL